MRLKASHRVDDFFVTNLKNYIAKHAEILSNEMLSEDSACPATHDCYLKVWQLSKPDLKAAVILFDEAQDSNPLLLDIVLQQKSQIILVGDPHQSIYSFRGTINALEVVDIPEYQLTQSFRYGKSIADLANRILALKKAKTEIKGFGNNSIIESTGKCRR